MTRPVLVLGIAPSPAQADGGEFWGSPSGARLRSILDRAEYYDGDADGPWFRQRRGCLPDFANIWPVALRDPRALTLRRFRGSRAEQLAHARCAGRHVIALGQQVLHLMWGIAPPLGRISVVQAPSGAGSVVCAFPHPSPRSRFWDESDALPRAVAWARAFYLDWRAADATAQGKGA